ncbi:MAG: molybdopterin molybdotransferase MoeA [Planctomycetaceae bacterium]|jgi:molybdopterin molybdotransferase|nr:molybdopterin molybdotransferase MoeA [Planctomycetaceae bacterium]MBT6154565.1 molybdopterin molybdotransferase MoeA [Planctomycetaceae bacterium]MBT6486595.1 molybdopterin molybdotransferase MoeA [Planctomycetaceae bacterium]MBT6494469.1 molybdopterin molybdotransferase MoeA [Planctomycetaceae bacterium]
MRGFTGRTLVDDALRWVDEHSKSLPGETIAFDVAHGRILAADVSSPINVPSFDRSAMDGYAVRGIETEGASDYNPLSFPIVGESMPGQPFPDTMPPGSAVRIMTGAPVPTGADAVIPAEYATETGATVEITSTVSPGKHVGRRGEDVSAGSQLFAAGRRLRPQDVGLLASVGVTAVEAVRRPRVRLLITGNELVVPGNERGEFQIYESNSSVLAALVHRDGAELESLMRVEDDREAISQAMCKAGADVVLVSGGSSVGKEDHAPSILAAEGDLAIHGIAMRPSSPTGMGAIQQTLVFLLPGNPVSCLCAYDFFAGRAIRRLGGRSAVWPYPQRQVEVGRKVVSAVGRVDYCRVKLNEGRAEPLALSGASILSSTTRADGFVVIPAESEGHAPGTVVTVYFYDPA